MKIKLFLVALMVLFCVTPAFAHLILEENFDYPDGAEFTLKYDGTGITEAWHTNNYCRDNAFTILGGKLYVNDTSTGMSQSAFYDAEAYDYIGAYKEARLKIQAINNGSAGFYFEFEDKIKFTSLGGSYNAIQIAINRNEGDVCAPNKLRIKMMTRRVNGLLEADYDQMVLDVNTFVEQELKITLEGDGFCRVYLANNGTWNLIYQGRTSLGGIDLYAFNSLMIRTGNLALPKGYVDAIRLYDEVDFGLLKITVAPIKSPVPEGSAVNVSWSTSKATTAQDTNVLVDGIETPGEPVLNGSSFTKVITAPYADTMEVEVFAVWKGTLIFSDPQVVQIIPSLHLSITDIPKKLKVLRPFQVRWAVDKYVGKTFITVVAEDKLILTGGSCKGFGPFKDLIKLKGDLYKKYDGALYIYANAIMNGHHYISEPKVLNIVKGCEWASIGKESLEKKNAAKLKKIKKIIKEKHLKRKK